MNLNNIPFISIVMACYNSELYIKDAIESVLNQDYKLYELIIVDDCSNDNTKSIITSYSKISSNIKYISLDKNSGIAEARNHGIRLASGDWVAILDSDDIFHEKKLSSQVNHLKISKLDNLVLIGTNCITIDGDNRRLKIYNYPDKSVDLVSNLLNLSKFPPHSSILYNLNALKLVGLFNTRFIKSQDYDLWLRLSTVGQFSLVDGQPLTFYRIHKSSISFSSIGYEQKVYVSAAILCHYLRMFINFDPSIKFNDNGWIDFLDWVSHKIEKSNYVIINNFKNHLKNILNSKRLTDISNVIFFVRALNIFFNRNVIYILINIIFLKSRHSTFLLHHWRKR